MNGFTLDRGCTSRDSQAIVVRTGSTLNLRSGTATGGWGGHGGAFDIESGTHVNLTDVIITGNHADDRGGGIWQGESATLNLQGKTTVIDNTFNGDVPSDFFLKTNAVITVTGSLAGSSIGVLMENNTGPFTSGFGTHNSGVDPATLFFSNLPETYQIAASESEAKVDILSSFQYIACSWDDVNKVLVKTQKTLSNCIPLGSVPSSEADYKVITGGGELGVGGRTGSYPEFYVVRGTVNRDVIRVNGTDVHLVLCDGATLNVNSIIVNPAYKLYFHVQSYGPSMGKLHADNNGHQETAAGIGSGNCGNNFDYTIHHGGYFTMYGGYVEAHGADNGAGIGGGEYSEGPKGVNIYGGTVKAYGGDDAAGIGGGYHWAKDLSSGTIHISGGEVYAWGKSEGAGIGGGENGKGADVTISSGIVEAHAGENEVSYRAIGPGRDNSNYGSLNLGDHMMVRFWENGHWSSPVTVSADRRNGAWYHTEARVEPCTHPGFTAETCPYHVHP